jgi:hypothetical protein
MYYVSFNLKLLHNLHNPQFVQVLPVLHVQRMLSNVHRVTCNKLINS